MICDYCTYYVFDEDLEENICMVNMDEDEYQRFLKSGNNGCPFFRKDDEYGIVKKQN